MTVKRNSPTSGEYSAGFYKVEGQTAYLAARSVAPIVMNVFSPRSIVDVGCGTGGFLLPFMESPFSLTDVIGVDGEWAIPHLSIPRSLFMPADLSKPLGISRRFDLAICLEVAEHIPQTSAGILVRTLTELAPVVLFSAAIPFQGGNRHVNEQWPEYWAALFLKHEYLVADILRRQIWYDRQVAIWYRQNIFLFLSPESADRHQELKNIGDMKQLSLVHPDLYVSHTMGAHTMGLRAGVNQLKRRIEQIGSRIVNSSRTV